MEKEIRREIIQELLAVLQKHDCTFAESNVFIL